MAPRAIVVAIFNGRLTSNSLLLDKNLAEGIAVVKEKIATEKISRHRLQLLLQYAHGYCIPVICLDVNAPALIGFIALYEYSLLLSILASESNILAHILTTLCPELHLILYPISTTARNLY